MLEFYPCLLRTPTPPPPTPSTRSGPGIGRPEFGLPPAARVLKTNLQSVVGDNGPSGSVSAHALSTTPGDLKQLQINA